MNLVQEFRDSNIAALAALDCRVIRDRQQSCAGGSSSRYRATY